jgi:Phytanoyl-CoA dioxygenase (PhyH)
MTTTDSSTPVEPLVETLFDKGYVIVRGLAPDLTNAAFEQLLPALDEAPVGHTPFLGERTKRLGGLLRRSTAVRELAIHPTVLAFGDKVLQPNCARYQLTFSGMMHLLPGAAAQQLHRDGDVYPFRHPSPPTLLSVMWALNDFTASNGATQLVPGSHRWEEDREPFADEVIAAEMPAGSVLLYLSGVIHGGGANVSDVNRTGLLLTYSLGWLRQEENQYLANPPEVARDFPGRLQRLIGYDYGGPYLGFVDGDTPQRMLVEAHDGPRNRSSPEVDVLAASMERHRWGNLECDPTPTRHGDRVSLNRGPIAEFAAPAS